MPRFSDYQTDYYGELLGLSVDCWCSCDRHYMENLLNTFAVTFLEFNARKVYG